MQVLLVAACDKPYVRELVFALRDKNPLLRLVLYILSKGLKTHAYRLRANILKDLFQVDQPLYNEINAYINCEVNVSYLVTMLFDNIPSFREKSICDNGCNPREKSIRVPSISHSVLKNPNFLDVMNDHVALKGPRVA